MKLFNYYLWIVQQNDWRLFKSNKSRIREGGIGFPETELMVIILQQNVENGTGTDTKYRSSACMQKPSSF